MAQPSANTSEPAEVARSGRGRYLIAAGLLAAAAGGAIYVAGQTDAERIEDRAFPTEESPAGDETAAAAGSDDPGGDDSGNPGASDNASERPVASPPLALKTYELDVPLADPVFEPEADTEWWNSEPLTQADLEGKVVFYDFWTFGCHNCQATLPSLRAWHDRYQADGLVVVGVHTAEFNFEKEPGNIGEAITDQGVTWPVVNDPEKKVWRKFDVHHWPTQAIYDSSGTLRYAHKGEGRYAEIEDYIRDVLDVAPDSPRSDDPEQA